MSLPQGWSKGASVRGHGGPVVPPRGPAPAPRPRPLAPQPPADGPIVETHVELRSLRAAEPASLERAEADEKILAAFWAAEEAMGFPLTDGQKDQQRRLMALSGSVATTGHARGTPPRGPRPRRDVQDSVLLTK